MRAAVVVIHSFFFFNDPATTEIYTLSLHDALPIFQSRKRHCPHRHADQRRWVVVRKQDRKSTRLNSSHLVISYAVFCLKKKIKDPPLPALQSKPVPDLGARRALA